MTWLLLCLISLALSNSYSLVSKKILSHQDDHDPIAYAAVLFVCVSICAAIFYVVSGVQLRDFAQLTQPDVLKILALNFVCYAIAPSFYYRALKHLPASEVGILYAMVGIYTLIIGVIFKTEAFLWTRALGGLLIFTATILVTFREGKLKVDRYVWMMIFATFVYAVAAITDNIVITRNYFTPAFFQILNFFVPMMIMLLINPGKIKFIKPILAKPKALRAIALNSIVFFFSFYTIFLAYKAGGSTSQVNIILSNDTILLVIFAAIFLNERSHFKLKLLAGVLTTVGVIFLA